MTDKTLEIESIIREGIRDESGPVPYPSDPFWMGLNALGSELWLDTGDIEAAAKLWTKEFTALTTNNTLLNTEIQKGIYDDLIARSGKRLSHLNEREKVLEIAFILNARHGLRLARQFGGRVSVELHTDLAHDIEGTLSYARRFMRISPEYFIVKVPLTPSGFIAARKLGDEKIPVNFTLGFSARQNYIAAVFAFPSFVNVFLGRLNAYIADNRLGDGAMVGEKATVASQRAVREASGDGGTGGGPAGGGFNGARPGEGTLIRTRQIAASMRGSAQVRDLAGIEVLTVPMKVAESARRDLNGVWEPCIDREYKVRLFDGIAEEGVQIKKLWELPENVKELAADLCRQAPRNGEELVQRCRAAGLHDLFPDLSAEELKFISQDGKIPKHERWEGRIRKGEAAIDSLLNLAGLASFSKDQRELDERIRKIID